MERRREDVARDKRGMERLRRMGGTSSCGQMKRKKKRGRRRRADEDVCGYSLNRLGSSVSLDALAFRMRRRESRGR